MRRFNIPFWKLHTFPTHEKVQHTVLQTSYVSHPWEGSTYRSANSIRFPPMRRFNIPFCKLHTFPAHEKVQHNVLQTPYVSHQREGSTYRSANSIRFPPMRRSSCARWGRTSRRRLMPRNLSMYSNSAWSRSRWFKLKTRDIRITYLFLICRKLWQKIHAIFLLSLLLEIGLFT